MSPKQRKIGGFLIILVGSSILWFVSKYKDVYEERMVVKVAWSNLPKDIILPEYSKQLEFNALVRDRGFSLLWRKLFAKQLDLDFGLSTFQRNDSVFINPSRVLERLNEEQRDMDVVSATRKDIYIPVQRIARKKVGLIKEFDVNYSSNFQPVKIIGFEPDSVIIYGDQEKLSKIKNLTINATPILVKDSISRKEFVLEDFFKDLQFETPSVNYTVYAAEMTEGSVTVPVQLINTPDKASVKLLPETVTIYYTTTIADFNKIQDTDFNVLIDYKSIKENNVSVVPTVELFSDKIKNVRLDNEFIQVLTII